MSEQTDLIDELASFNIVGGWNSTHQMARAITIAFEQINKRHKNEPKSVTFASIAQQIKSFWKSELESYLRSKGSKATFGRKHEKKVDDFVSTFKQLVDEYYGGSLNKAYRYRFNIRDAYVWKISRKNKEDNKKEQ